MTKRELKKLMRERKLKKGEYKVSFEASIDARKVKLEFESIQKMSAYDFLLIATDWVNDYAADLYAKSKDTTSIEYEPDGSNH